MTASLEGRVCLLTGATRGIGRSAAEALVHTGMELVLVSRDATRLESFATSLRRSAPSAKVSIVAGDLARMVEVRRVAVEVRARHDRLHVLLNNVGAVFARRELTVEGLERTMALNHLSPFVLTTELLPLLRGSTPSRVVTVSSGAHRGMRLDFDDLMFERRRYRGLTAYGRSKLMNILFTRELARRLEGTGVTANAMHPGFVRTGFGHNTPGLLSRIISLGQIFARSPEHGARTLVYLATAPEVERVSGKYFLDEREAPISAVAKDMSAARRLWDESEQLVGPRQVAASRAKGSSG
jgi:retinol dehydrogenase-12